MQGNDVSISSLIAALGAPLHHIEETILNQMPIIEYWFREQWHKTPPPITSSVDLRHSGFKLAPVDTNLFPAGFNNLNPDCFPLCVQAVQSVMFDAFPRCKSVLFIPESHTRNRFYWHSLNILRDIFIQAGFVVRVGSLDQDVKHPQKMTLDDGKSFLIEPLSRRENRICLDDFEPCMLLLNNDLSSGFPDILNGIEQPIQPTPKLGWSNRLKSSHFNYFNDVASEFAKLVNCDAWLINPYFTAMDDVDFMANDGVDRLASETDRLIEKINQKYIAYGIQEKPFVVIKADNGTYGMSVMMAHEGKELLQLNRKQRTRMAASKGGRKVSRVLLQEGVFTFETMSDGSVAEPVVYLLGPFVVGGFYRVHKNRGNNENLNSPGMHFEPLPFSQACNTPNQDLDSIDSPNRFYAYGVIARLAALAAAREIAAIR